MDRINIENWNKSCIINKNRTKYFYSYDKLLAKLKDDVCTIYSKQELSQTNKKHLKKFIETYCEDKILINK